MHRETAIPYIPNDLKHFQSMMNTVHTKSVKLYGIDPPQTESMHDAFHLLKLKNHKDTSWKYEEQTLAVQFFFLLL